MLLHLLDFHLILNYDVWNHELKIHSTVTLWQDISYPCSLTTETIHQIKVSINVESMLIELQTLQFSTDKAFLSL